MALRNLRYDGDPILRKSCREVEEVTPRIEQLIDDMFDTMYEENGVGLAGPQVGVLKRIFVIDIGEGPLEFINTKIIEESGSQTGGEGCLSLPGKIATVTRPNHVICEAYNRKMEKFTIEAEGLLARAICHENDHLDGILYKDVADSPVVNVEDYEE